MSKDDWREVRLRIYVYGGAVVFGITMYAVLNPLFEWWWVNY